MSKHRVLSLKAQLRLEWRGRDGQNETEQPDHSASLGVSITSSTRIRFSAHNRFQDLHHEGDPIVGSPAEPKKFTIPGLPSGDEVSLETLTRTLGGGYFFLLGIKALEFIVERSVHPTLSDSG